MSARLIPFGLALTGFLVVLTAFNWQGRPDGAIERVPPQAAAGPLLVPTPMSYIPNSELSIGALGWNAGSANLLSIP